MSTELSFSVMESHIDLLFLEEFYSSKEFQNWFISRTTADKHTKRVIRTEHSVFESDRESDLEISFEGTDGIDIFLIENKIDAQFQPNQALDYKKRALEYVRRGKCSRSHTVLFAPNDYISAAKTVNKFDYYISFESVISFFKSQTQLENRAAYKMEVLNRAIGKFHSKRSRSNSTSSSTYQPSKTDDKMTQFWMNYWNDLSERIPELHMPKPTIKGPNATFIFLGKDQLPPNVVIAHKFLKGYVDLQFERLGENVETFIENHRNLLEKEMSIHKVGKSGVAIRLNVPEINPYKFYDEIQNQVHQAQNAAKKLLTFWRDKGA